MRPERAQVWAQGFVAGLLGYVAVAIFFGVVNVIGGHSPFQTAGALGSVIFYGVRDPAQILIEPGPVLAYNGVHLILSLLVGTVGAWLLYETERHHFLWYFVFFIFLAGFVYSIFAIGIIGVEIARVVPWWSVLIANVLWITAIGVYLWTQHRELMHTIEREQGSAA